MVHIKHRVGIRASVTKVYQALSTIDGISNWWSRYVSGQSETGKTIAIAFYDPDGNEVGNMRIEVLDLQPEHKVHWRFITGPQEWVGTDVVFELYPQDGYTIVHFSHMNWAQEVEFMSHCSMKWAIFMLSLKQFVETGKGRPSPDDVKIDNWN